MLAMKIEYKSVLIVVVVDRMHFRLYFYSDLSTFA